MSTSALERSDGDPQENQPGREPYEPPEVIEVGDIVALTKGTGEYDTADMKRWYY